MTTLDAAIPLCYPLDMSPAQQITVKLCIAAGPEVTRAALAEVDTNLRARPTIEKAALVTAMRAALKGAE